MWLLKSPYILIFFWIAFIAFICSTTNAYELVEVNGHYERRIKKSMAFIIFVPLIIWASTRNIGDTGLYRTLFYNYPSELSGALPYIIEGAKDVGFIVFTIFLKTFIGNTDKLYFLIIGFISCYCLYKTYKEHSCDYLITFFLFIASADYVAWLYNGMRQFLVAAIMFACAPLILKKKYVPLIVILLILSTVHKSVLLMLPFIFIVQGKAFNVYTLLFMFATIMSVLFLNNFTDLLTTVLEDTQYEVVIDQMQNDDGTNLLRVLVYSVPTIFALWQRRRIVEYGSPIINLSANMSIVSMGFYIISMFTSGIFIGRIPIYFSLYNYILLPWLIDHTFTKQSAKIVKIIMIGCYFLFYYYQMFIAWGMY